MQTVSIAAVVITLAIFSAGPAQATTCKVREGVVADVTRGPMLPTDDTVVLKSSYKAEFRWELWDKESIGWMRITDGDGKEIGWVPAGHEGVQCGDAN